MTYTADENSVHDGEPVLAFRFVSNAKVYRYTNNPAELTVNSEVYTPLQINLGEITSSINVTEQVTTDLTMPFDCGLAKDFRPNDPRGDLVLTVYRAHRGNLTDFRVVWAAQGLSYNLSGRVLTIQTGPALQNALNNATGAVLYQRNCNNLLYDERCKVSRAANTTSSTVVGVNGRFVQVANDGVIDNDLRAGQIINGRTGETRLVISNQANVITMAFAFSDVLLNDPVTMERGCIHTYGECGDKFNNRTNYTGFVYLSTTELLSDDV